ncbi:hypothetical protein FUA23_04990 [Neolewinella aurantiaca]|uniref:Uncharacterized protein n=1 Tax=Neolewinella aurantiaca TaxID=2602767 RepID=A0A5C7FVW8_9BACT|nr:hypothetical protein [Neolewinella aurantiaca]TXF90797.1 hypothetical protein FUA23_04990 [Neolewinella aurantiaca]
MLTLSRMYILALVFCFSADSCSQPSPQPDHLTSLASKYGDNYPDGCDYGEPTFLDYVINRILPDTTYKKYLTDRALMRKLKVTNCLNNLVEVEDRLDDGRPITLSFETSRLDTNQHTIVRRSKSTVLSIDSMIPYGAEYWSREYLPQRLSRVTITIGGRALTIPGGAFSNLYNPNMCQSAGWLQPIEVYTEGDGIYIYIYGGNAADTYFAKVIFYKDKYITTLIADYGPLPCYGTFRPNFPGF